MADAGQAAACAAAYAREPALAGVRPAVERAGPNRVFVFRGQVPGGPGARPLARVLRVTVGPDDRVIRLTVSR